MGRRFNDLESGFEKYLCFPYGRHIFVGIPLLHNIGLESGGGTGMEGIILSALGDGAYNEAGEGAWGVCAITGGNGGGGGTAECTHILKLDHESLSQADGSEITSFLDEGVHGYTFVPIGLSGTTGPLYDTTPADNSKFSEQSGPVHRALKVSGNLNNDISLLGAFTITFALSKDAWIGGGQSFRDIFHVDDDVGAGGNEGWEVEIMDIGGGNFRVGMERYGNGGGFIGGTETSSTYSWGSTQKLVVSIVCNGTDVRIMVNGVEETLGGPLSARGKWYNAVDNNEEYFGTSVGSIAKSAYGMAYRTFINGPFFGKLHYFGIVGHNLSDSDRQAIESPVASAIGASYTNASCSIAGDPCNNGGNGNGEIEICETLERVLYSGFDIPIETNVHFHPGTISKGTNDPIQGEDPWFPGAGTFSATPNAAVLLPEGIDEDVDGSKLAFIAKTSSIADYDADGNMISLGYSANPARVKADGLKRRGQHNRIVWSSYISARDYYDGLLNWEAGDTTNTYLSFTGVPVSPTISGNISFNAGSGAMSKPSATDADDNQVLTKERILEGTSGYFKWVIGAAFPNFTGGGAVYLIDSTGKGWYGLVWGNGHYAHYANGVPIDKKEEPYLYPGTNGDTNEIGVDGSGNFYWKKNNTLMSIPQGVAPAPFDIDLFAKISLWESSAAISSCEFSGKKTNTTTNNITQVKRFEAHPAFTSPVDLGTFLDYVDLLTASDTQEAGKDIIFLTPEPRTPIHDFDEDTNVIGDIRVYETDIRERPNRLWCTYRNLDTQFLEKDSEFDLRDDLFNRVGRTIDPGAYNFAGMSSSQAQRMIKYRMRIDSDNFRWCDLKGDHTSLKVLAAHVVRVISREYRVEVNTGGFSAAATSISLKSGESLGFRLPEMEVPFFATVWNSTDHSNPLNDPDREVIQVTNVNVDILTIVRGQQGTSAVAHNTAGKTYVIGRIPKRFKVINCTRENAEITALTRDFILQEYYPDDYRDTDHSSKQGRIDIPIPSPFDCPPTPVLELEQRTTDAVGGTITKIIGTIHFGVYAFSQSAKIFVTKEGGSEIDTGLVITPSPGTTTGIFEYVAEESTTYTVRVQILSAANAPCGSVSEEITLANFIEEDGTDLFIVEDGTGLFVMEDQ